MAPIPRLTHSHLYLDGQISKMAKSPLLGKSRDYLRPGYRSIQLERHLIFYRVTDTAVEIVRVLHDSMDPELHL